MYASSDHGRSNRKANDLHEKAKLRLALLGAEDIMITAPRMEFEFGKRIVVAHNPFHAT